ncbi:Protein disulfide isomerase like protein [Quillaja saponaria]|uniref:protein disulfide-isomerase n=1 Tax=Quillaja saponaria TaxID=32244 RepID=A0AAD7L547_QUISA|nr:Protein disulfide isomerase like protein [Quillaja saponaria]
MIRKPTSKFVLFILTFVLVTSYFTGIMASESVPSDNDEEDLEGIEELLAVDEEVERQPDGESVKSSEAEVLTKAQRIVLELNSDNTKRVVDGNEFVLVLGYAPWCPRSAELMPQFAEAATSLKELGSPLLMAKLDAERYPKAASLIGIKGFPTLILFVNGTSQVYTGGFTAEEIVTWGRKKTGVPVIRISSVTEAEKFLKKYHTFVIGFFQKYEGPEYEEFVDAAKSDSELQFVEVSNDEVAKVVFPDVQTTGLFLGIVKSEPERYTTYDGAFQRDKILEFLENNKFPLVTKLTEINSVRVYSSPVKLQVFVFAEEDGFKNLLECLQDVAKTFKSKIMFIYVDIKDENLAKPFLTLFGLEESEDPVVAAFDNRASKKFLLESKPTRNNIQEFCTGLLHGTLLPFFKSLPIPDNREASIKTIVGKTFGDAVLSSPKNVLLEVYTPWCINCEATSKHVEKLAKHFKDLDSLVFARIDASANEHPKLLVDDYPTLLLYQANDKANPIKLSTKSSLKELAASINKHLKAQDQVAKDEL